MAETEGSIGFGVQVGVSASSTDNTFAALLEITDVSGPEIAVDDVEMTHSESPDRYKEWLPGLIDGGEVTVECNYTKENCAAVYALVGVKKYYKITLPDGGSTWKFPGYIKGFGEEEPIDDKIQNQVTIKVGGKPVFTAAA